MTDYRLIIADSQLRDDLYVEVEFGEKHDQVAEVFALERRAFVRVVTELQAVHGPVISAEAFVIAIQEAIEVLVELDLVDSATKS